MSAELEPSPSPDAIAAELHEFTRSVTLFSSGAEPLIEKYDRKWISVLDGEVKAISESYDGIFAEMERLGIDRRFALVRHIRKNQRTLIV